MKLVLYLASVPSEEILEETSRLPARFGLSSAEEPPTAQDPRAFGRADFQGRPSWAKAFAGKLSLRTYLQPTWYSRGTSPSPTFSLQSDNYLFRGDDVSPESAESPEEVAAERYALFMELAKAYYDVLRPVVGITFDEDHEPVVLFWEDAMACHLEKLYNLTLLSPQFKNINDPAVADGLEVHRVERLPDGGLLISLVDYPLRGDIAVRIGAEVELGLHPDVDPSEFRGRVALFDQALHDTPELVAREAGLSDDAFARGKAASIAAGLPPFSFLNLLRQSAVENALRLSRKPNADASKRHSTL